MSPREYLPPEDLLDESIQKITLSTQLTQDTKTTEISLPKWCKDFEDVFSEKTYNTLPPHCPYDHTIDLKPSFVPKIAKVYPLNPKEKEACQAFVEEHLKTGRILPSKSPQAAPFFFVPKKDGSLHPCQDYRYLNSHTIFISVVNSGGDGVHRHNMMHEGRRDASREISDEDILVGDFAREETYSTRVGE